jgi:hypothetical protein
MYTMDSSGATSATADLPSAPANGTSALFKATGAMVSPPQIVAAGTDTVELYTAPGTFSAAAGTTAIVTQGGLFGIKYNAGTGQWIAFIIF